MQAVHLKIKEIYSGIIASMSQITSDQYDYLMSLPKRFLEDETIDLGSVWTKELESIDSREKFILDHHNSMTEINKHTLNERYRTNVVLARLCTMKRHTNPDGTTFPGAHFHLYDELYGDSIAHPISVLGLEEPFTSEQAFEAFANYCKIELPRIQTTLAG